MFVSTLSIICRESLQRDLSLFLAHTNYTYAREIKITCIFIYTLHLLFKAKFRHSLHAIRPTHHNVYARYYDYVEGTMCLP